MAKAAPEDILSRIAAIRRHKEGGFVAPNKPVTLLWALARLEEGKPRLVPFSQFATELRPLLTAAGRPKTLPVHAFWALQTDGLWEVVADGELTGRAGSREPTTTSLREKASGGLREEIHNALRDSPPLREAAASILREQLREFTPDAVRIPPASSARQTVERLVRDPAFRQGALKAYGGRCVVCGWSVRSNGKPSLSRLRTFTRWSTEAQTGPATASSFVSTITHSSMPASSPSTRSGGSCSRTAGRRRG